MYAAAPSRGRAVNSRGAGRHHGAARHAHAFLSDCMYSFARNLIFSTIAFASSFCLCLYAALAGRYAILAITWSCHFRLLARSSRAASSLRIDPAPPRGIALGVFGEEASRSAAQRESHAERRSWLPLRGSCRRI